MVATENLVGDMSKIHRQVKVCERVRMGNKGHLVRPVAEEALSTMLSSMRTASTSQACWIIVSRTHQSSKVHQMEKISYVFFFWQQVVTEETVEMVVTELTGRMQTMPQMLDVTMITDYLHPFA